MTATRAFSPVRPAIAGLVLALVMTLACKSAPGHLRNGGSGSPAVGANAGATGNTPDDNSGAGTHNPAANANPANDDAGMPDFDVGNATEPIGNHDGAPYRPTAEEVIAQRVALMRFDYRWPRGMYPFGLRAPAWPRDPDAEDSRWRFIHAAQAMHSRRVYDKTIEYLEFAAAEKEDGDTLLVAFNLGAARVELAGKVESGEWAREHAGQPDGDAPGDDGDADSTNDAGPATPPDPDVLRDRALVAWRRVLGLRFASDYEGPLWPGAGFRHFACGAVARLLMERGDRVTALEYGLMGAWQHPPIDAVTATELPMSHARDSLLPLLYAYADADIAIEPAMALTRLITHRRPRLSGQVPGDLVAGFFISCLEQRDAMLADRATERDLPACMQREFLQRLLRHWLDDFPDHASRARLTGLAGQAGIQ